MDTSNTISSHIATALLQITISLLTATKLQIMLSMLIADRSECSQACLPKSASFCAGIQVTQLNTIHSGLQHVPALGPTWVNIPNRISIGWDILVQLTVVSNRQTNWAWKINKDSIFCCAKRCDLKKIKAAQQVSVIKSMTMLTLVLRWWLAKTALCWQCCN